MFLVCFSGLFRHRFLFAFRNVFLLDFSGFFQDFRHKCPPKIDAWGGGRSSRLMIFPDGSVLEVPLLVSVPFLSNFVCFRTSFYDNFCNFGSLCDEFLFISQHFSQCVFPNRVFGIILVSFWYHFAIIFESF